MVFSTFPRRTFVMRESPTASPQVQRWEFQILQVTDLKHLNGVFILQFCLTPTEGLGSSNAVSLSLDEALYFMLQLYIE